MLLETLSESDIQLLDRRVTDDLGSDEHQQDQGITRGITCITVANASDISCHSPSAIFQLISGRGNFFKKDYHCMGKLIKVYINVHTYSEWPSNSYMIAVIYRDCA